MERTARNLILELYKDDHITKEETDLLLDAITLSKQVQLPYVDWTYRTNDQPRWTYDPNRPGQPFYTVT